MTRARKVFIREWNSVAEKLGFSPSGIPFITRMTWLDDTWRLRSVMRIYLPKKVSTQKSLQFGKILYEWLGTKEKAFTEAGFELQITNEVSEFRFPDRLQDATRTEITEEAKTILKSLQPPKTDTKYLIWKI